MRRASGRRCRGAISSRRPGQREVVEVICSACRSPAVVIGKQRTKAEWKSTMTQMLQEETDVTEEETDKIIDYLSANFPAKINVNKAAASELETALELPAKDAEAIVHYREEKGDFKTLDDLKKVPGVDAARIEANKDRLAF